MLNKLSGWEACETGVVKVFLANTTIGNVTSRDLRIQMLINLLQNCIHYERISAIAICQIKLYL